MNKISKENNEKIPSIVTFNKTLTDVRHIINKNWDILLIEPRLKEIFKIPLLLPLKETKISVTLLEVIKLTILKTNTCKNFR